jgi:hypothetical protein
MPRIYRNMKDHLLEFQAFRGEAITFNSLDLTFYENFVDFLSIWICAEAKKRTDCWFKDQYDRENYQTAKDFSM